MALWIAEHNFWPTVGVKVHSYNAVGARRIMGVVDRYGPYDHPCVWTPAPILGQDLTREQCEMMASPEDLTEAYEDIPQLD